MTNSLGNKVVAHVPQCKTCNTRGTYDSVFDAYVCEGCDRWLEGECGTDGCGFCRARPPTPSGRKQ